MADTGQLRAVRRGWITRGGGSSVGVRPVGIAMSRCRLRCGTRSSPRRVSTGSTAPHLDATPDPARALPATTFVELAPSGLASPPACVIEIDGPRGTLRIRLGGLALRDLVAMAQLWGEAS